MIKKIPCSQELIGEKMEVAESKNKSNIGLTGTIVDETKMTLVVESHGKRRMLFKNNIIFKLIKNNKLICGSDILKRPEERIKSK